VLDDPHAEFMVQESKVSQSVGHRVGSRAQVEGECSSSGDGGETKGRARKVPRSSFTLVHTWCTACLSLPQGVGRDDLTPDGQLAFWYSRYTLRRQAVHGGTVPEPHAQLDVPVFLRAHAETILTTGVDVLVHSKCGSGAWTFGM
jgi:hypothetical protein